MQVMLRVIITILVIESVRSWCLSKGYGVGDKDVIRDCSPKHCFEDNGKYFCTKCLTNGDRKWSGNSFLRNVRLAPDLRSCPTHSNTLCTNAGYTEVTWNGGYLCTCPRGKVLDPNYNSTSSTSIPTGACITGQCYITNCLMCRGSNRCIVCSGGLVPSADGSQCIQCPVQGCTQGCYDYRHCKTSQFTSNPTDDKLVCGINIAYCISCSDYQTC